VFALRGVVVQQHRNQWSGRNLAPPVGSESHEVGGRDPCQDGRSGCMTGQ
jgi:hypothetical protein